MERYFKDQLKSLVERGEYDASDQTDRYMYFMVNLLTNLTW